MKKILLSGLLVLFTGACDKQDAIQSETDDLKLELDGEHAVISAEASALAKEDPVGAYGAGTKMRQSTSLASLFESPLEFEGRTVQVQGRVAAVCQKRGCWVEIQDIKTSESIRLKVTDGDIVFPLTAVGRNITAEGILEKIELDTAAARNWLAHQAEELGESFDPSNVTEGMTIWRLAGKGAIIK